MLENRAGRSAEGLVRAWLSAKVGVIFPGFGDGLWSGSIGQNDPSKKCSLKDPSYFPWKRNQLFIFWCGVDDFAIIFS